MKISRLFLAVLFVSLISLASPAFADNVQLIGATGPVVGGVYVTPYQLQDSAILGGATINVVCDDFSDDVVPGETWTAQIETFDSNGVLSPGAMFASVGNTAYDKAVYLYSEFLNGAADAGGVNYAIWGLFDPSVVGSSAYNSTDAQSLLAAITGADLTGFSSYTSFEVITPTSLGSIGTEPQEYIYRSSVPEPSSLLLLSSGLLSLGFMKRKLFQS